jgi:hypothetical protein
MIEQSHNIGVGKGEAADAGVHMSDNIRGFA